MEEEKQNKKEIIPFTRIIIILVIINVLFVAILNFPFFIQEMYTFLMGLIRSEAFQKLIVVTTVAIGIGSIIYTASKSKKKGDS